MKNSNLVTVPPLKLLKAQGKRAGKRPRNNIIVIPAKAGIHLLSMPHLVRSADGFPPARE